MVKSSMDEADQLQRYHQNSTRRSSVQMQDQRVNMLENRRSSMARRMSLQPTGGRDSGQTGGSSRRVSDARRTSIQGGGRRRSSVAPVPGPSIGAGRERRGSIMAGRRMSVSGDRRASIQQQRRDTLIGDRQASTVKEGQISIGEGRRVSVGVDLEDLKEAQDEKLKNMEGLLPEREIVRKKEKERQQAEAAAKGDAPVDPKARAKEKQKQKVLHKASKFRCIMYDFTDSGAFSGFILLVIFMNTGMLIGNTWPIVSVRAGWYLSALDSTFLGIYVMEIVLKLYVWRKLFFKETWNILDFLIVVFNLGEFILPFAIRNMGTFNGAAIFRLLRIFRTVRAIRALRVLRTIRFLQNLQVIMTTCLQSVQSMGAIVMLIFLFMYMFAVIGRGFYGSSDPERFGTMLTAWYTLFQLLTLDDWSYIYYANKDQWHIIVYLLLYIIMEYFIFLNLFVAVLVDNFQLTLEAASEAMKKKKKAMVVEEDDDDLFAGGVESDSESSVASEDSTKLKPRKTVEEHYSYCSPENIDSLARYLRILASLEYNEQMYKAQQKTLDMMVDMCADTNDDM